MSTSSVAFFVGQFECLDCNDRQSLVDVYSHLGSLYQTEYVDGVASDLLETMENYTAVKYGLPKLNLLAVPELGLDAAGNWGLNMHRCESKNEKVPLITDIIVRLCDVVPLARRRCAGVL